MKGQVAGKVLLYMNHMDAAKEAALSAGNFIMRKLGRVKKISYKGRINLVTEADTGAERIIIRALKKHYPDYGILAEESGAVKNGPSEYKWVIDPLDGTTNFAHGFPVFCVSVGLEKDLMPALGVVFDPTRKELFYAQKGRGAYLNGRRIRVSSVPRLSRSLLVTGFTYNLRKARNTNLANFRRFVKSAQAVRRAGSAALDLCYVACGRFDGFWEMDLNPWDTAAAGVIAKEAGARISDFSGMPFSHYKKQVLATNGRIHRAMLKALNQRRG